MRTYSIDYSTDRPDPRVLINRGFWVHDVPRLIPLCRLIGHKPVVDGTQGVGTSKPARWVACDRCGLRTHPQGCLNPAQWNIGDPYLGPLRPQPELSYQVQKQLARLGHSPRQTEPGVWPAEPTTTVGGQIIIGRAHGFGIEAKVGNPGSEQVLAGHISLGPLGALYLHTEDHGRWLQRRLNNIGYDSRVISVDIHHGRLSWNLWARRDEHRASDPKWMRGSTPVDPRHYLYGPRKNRKVTETEKIPATVRMPEGDTYEVTVHLEQWESGRTRGRSRTYWRAQWDCKAGIPVRNHDWKGDETFSCSWMIEGVTPDNPRWPHIVAAAAAEQCSRDRARYNYQAPAAA
jgi:hypothetical protein